LNPSRVKKYRARGGGDREKKYPTEEPRLDLEPVVQAEKKASAAGGRFIPRWSRVTNYRWGRMAGKG